MLARTYKTAEELNIKQEQYDALKEVLLLLEAPEPIIVNDKRLVFNISLWCCKATTNDKQHSVNYCCIGGMAEEISNATFDRGWMRDVTMGLEVETALYRLFYPRHASIWVTQAHAAKALANYLSLGEPYWTDVMAT